MKNRKKVILFAGLFWMISILCGCGREDVTEKTTQEQIIIWTWDETFNVKAAKTAATLYEEEHPELMIQVITKEREEIQTDIKNLLSAELYEDCRILSCWKITMCRKCWHSLTMNLWI